MKNLRVPMIVLAALHLAFTILTGAAGGFADAGTIPERILLSLVHPAAAILLLVAVASSRPLSRGLRGFTLALLVVAVVSDIVLGVLIGQGVVKGDWFLPLVFAVVPALGVAYMTASATKAD